MGRNKGKMAWGVAGVLLLLPIVTQAQCAMCRAVLENSDDTSAAEGVNNGIVFLMAMPYLLVGFIGFMIYKKFRK
ncbi:hypothetical protein NBRC110019_00610 [Neptunitalea chrysea]|uniref:Uncharacterized protein n=1 Tax=Neptunitalea chrysea TaxID=1647581 RepID=A0A9W6EU83_9FLAO|nr:hypothetical protein [Neptunitalea chrysea]GLB51022.1 hypothetical protein NBRC110019_00610 [Neptunitalea chrysea]